MNGSFQTKRVFQATIYWTYMQCVSTWDLQHMDHSRKEDCLNSHAPTLHPIFALPKELHVLIQVAIPQFSSEHVEQLLATTFFHRRKGAGEAFHTPSCHTQKHNLTSDDAEFNPLSLIPDWLPRDVENFPHQINRKFAHLLLGYLLGCPGISSKMTKQMNISANIPLDNVNAVPWIVFHAFSVLFRHHLV